MRKYGIENFSFKILEELPDGDIQHVVTQESKWIDKLNSLAPYGYNLVALDSPSQGGNASRFSETEKEEVRDALKQKVAIKKVAEKYSISRSFCSQINTGERWFSKEENYPLQINRTQPSVYKRTIELLKYSKMSMSSIAKEINMSSDFVQRVNRGKQQAVREYHDDFPIRKNIKGSYKLNL